MGEQIMTDQSSTYVLGHADQELARLTRQADSIDPSTRQFFREAGIASGMRVLDIGSGAGHTAFVAAELVGATGEVIGTDRAADAIKTAQKNAQTRALRNVSFRHGDPSEMIFERPFDAVVGRYVLVFNLDQPTMLRQLAKHLKPGGVIVFQEPTMLVARSIPRVDLYERCCHWMLEGFRVGGAQVDTAVDRGRRLFRGTVPPHGRRVSGRGQAVGRQELGCAATTMLARAGPHIECGRLGTGWRLLPTPSREREEHIRVHKQKGGAPSDCETVLAAPVERVSIRRPVTFR